MYNDFIYEDKMEFLAFEDQRHFVFLLCMKNMGLLDKEYPKAGMLDRVVAKRLGLYGEAFDNAKLRLIDVGVIDADWQPTAWNKRQFISDSDPSHAERQRRYRERKKQESNCDVTRDVTVTPLDTDTDTETEQLHGACAPAASDADDQAAALACPTQKLVDAYHELMPDNPRIRVLDAARRRTIVSRWKEASRLTAKPFGYTTVEQGLEAWRTFFEVCNDSDFLTGKAPAGVGRTKPFIADLDFLLSPKGFKGCLENKYHREAA